MRHTAIVAALGAAVGLTALLGTATPAGAQVVYPGYPAYGYPGYPPPPGVYAPPVYAAPPPVYVPPPVYYAPGYAVGPGVGLYFGFHGRR
jgi:hypothetical protein